MRQRRKGRWRKILLVDDDPDFVEAVSLILKSKKFDVVTAYNGIEGLNKVTSEKPDLIVLDVMMPEKDGYAVCKELKSNSQLSHIPVLLLTAVASHVPTTRYTQEMGLETEADDYLDKPVEPNVLVKRIESLLSK
jgi:two-component system alkaline phosphatase synthesis response regulator PhoP